VDPSTTVRRSLRQQHPGVSGLPTGPADRAVNVAPHRATLRSALNAAIRDGLIWDNPARRIELPSPRRPQAHVWTDQRVAAWRRTGQRCPVEVWTARQLAGFLDHVREDRLFAMWWLTALRGLRRGEAAGLRWTDLDLDHKVIMIGQQRIAYGHTVEDGKPKTKASRRTIGGRCRNVKRFLTRRAGMLLDDRLGNAHEEGYCCAADQCTGDRGGLRCVAEASDDRGPDRRNGRHRRREHAPGYVGCRGGGGQW
jgi:integrase